MTEMCPYAITKMLLKIGGTTISWSSSKDNFFSESVFAKNAVGSLFRNRYQLIPKLCISVTLGEVITSLS